MSLRATPITVHETIFKKGDMPKEFRTAAGCHDTNAARALEFFKLYVGTADMVPTMVMAVYDKEAAVRFFPLDWRNEEEKTSMIRAMRGVFADPQLRPDRYTFHGEVWIATQAVDDKDDRRPSERPDSLDGLTVLTVDAKLDRPIYTAFTRTKTGGNGAIIEKFADSREDPQDVKSMEGRLANLLVPLDDEDTSLVIFDR